jgi:hypothetical protein
VRSAFAGLAMVLATRQPYWSASDAMFVPPYSRTPEILRGRTEILDDVESSDAVRERENMGCSTLLLVILQCKQATKRRRDHQGRSNSLVSSGAARLDSRRSS